MNSFLKIICFLFALASVFDCRHIRLSNGIKIDTIQRKSLALKKSNLVDPRYAKYGLKDYTKLSQFFIEISDGKSHEDLTRIVGEPETVIDSMLGIWTTSAATLRALESQNMISWTGLFKSHYKFSAQNFADKTRPYNQLIRFSNTEKFSFVLTVSNSIPMSDVLKLKDQWIEEFKLLKSKFNIKLTGHEGSRYLDLEILAPEHVTQINNVYDEVFKLFAEKPEITYFERKLPLKFHNFEASTILQSNYRSITGNQYDLVYRNGITGNGQIVCVADTGLSVFHFSSFLFLILHIKKDLTLAIASFMMPQDPQWSSISSRITTGKFFDMIQ